MKEINDLSVIKRAQNGDESAKEELFIANTPLLKSIIRRFKNKGVEYEDLFQIASIGFIKALNNFDESFNVKFSTYTVPMIIGEIKRYMRDNGTIKISRNLKILALKINRFIGEYQVNHEDSPSIELIAKKFDVSESDVALALDSNKMPLSLFDKFNDEDEGQEIIDRISDDFTEEKMINKIHVSNILEKLPERERKIIVLRYFRDRTQSEIAESLGVSQVQVSRLENKILEKLRENF